MALMVWDKNNEALFVIKQKVFINNWDREWEGGEVILYPNLLRRKTEQDLGTSLGGGSTKICFIKKKMWNIWTKRVLHCTSQPSIATNHWALNTIFTHLFFNILKEIQEFKSNGMMTPPSVTFANLQSRGTNLTAHTKLWPQAIPRSRREFKYNL